MSKGLNMGDVTDLLEQHRGHFWIGCDNAVWRWTGDAWSDGERQFQTVPAEYGPFQQKFGPRRRGER